MLKKTITYTDYNGETRTEDFWFNFSKAELMEMEYSEAGGFNQLVQKIISTKDVPAIIRIFKNLVLQAYGEKSPDGRRFIKSEELSREFAQTEAYTELFMELGTNEKAAAEFINGVIPQNLEAELNKVEKGAKADTLPKALPNA